MCCVIPTLYLDVNNHHNNDKMGHNIQTWTEIIGFRLKNAYERYTNINSSD